MRRSVSENLILPFIKKNPAVAFFALLLILGVLLMLAPSGGGEDSGSEAVSSGTSSSGGRASISFADRNTPFCRSGR